MRNEVLDIVTSELDAIGIAPVIQHGGKHVKVHWKVHGKTRIYTASKTASDHRAAANARTTVRRMLREDGLLDVNLTEPTLDTKLLKRIDKLQSTIDALTELVLELPARLEPKKPEPKPTRRVNQSTIALKEERRRHEEQLLELIPYTNWIPSKRLYMATTVPKPYQVIARLRNRGLIEQRGNTQTSEWRRATGLPGKAAV